MLNGSGADATFTELVGDDDSEGQAVPKRMLSMDDVDRMDGFGFEVFCCLLWSKRGFQSSLTPKRGGDGGIDVVALRGADGQLLQCKSSINPEVGWDAIKEVTAGAARYQARFPGTRFHKVAVTNQSFTASAAEQANANRVELVTRAQVRSYLDEHPVSNLEFEGALVSWRLQEAQSA
jgi:HJR/Mrr/RecB family endonuclease